MSLKSFRFRVQGSGFKFQGLGFRFQGSGFLMQGLMKRILYPRFWFLCVERRGSGTFSRPPGQCTHDGECLNFLGVRSLFSLGCAG